jgi:hypothetical protein
MTPAKVTSPTKTATPTPASKPAPVHQATAVVKPARTHSAKPTPTPEPTVVSSSHQPADGSLPPFYDDYTPAERACADALILEGLVIEDPTINPCTDVSAGPA